MRPLKPWPQPVVESHGDYRADAFLEKHIGGPLYEHQSTLPSLPVPTIEETLARFLPSALPLAESDAERERLIEACNVFPQQAAKLQERLQKRYEESKSQNTSWLQLWWNTWGYLQVRDPVVLNVSYFFQLADDGTLPAPSDGKSLGVMRGATILRAVGEYRKLVCSGSLPCEMIGRREPKTPLCSVAFKYMFNACRIPAREQDTYKMYDPSLHRHCIVANKGYFFAVDFVDENGEPLPFRIVEERLQRCVNMAEELQSMGTVPQFGLLTTSDRDSWADVRGRLLNVGREPMERALNKLESGAFLLCLDDNEPLSLQQCGVNYWHGGNDSGHNRWFDKSMQFVCTKNGKVGFVGEHSMMDGMPAVNLCAHVVNTKYSKASSNNGGAISGHYSASGGVEHVFDDCIVALEGDNAVRNDVNRAEETFSEKIQSNELTVQSFRGYGANHIKTMGYSPDAFIQQAIQLATFRLFGRQCATYESTQVRPFLQGRTETTRSVTPASSTFVSRMGLRPLQEIEIDGVSSVEEKKLLLQEAAKSHVDYISNAARALGVDRHFIGLSMMVGEGKDAPTLFSDDLFLRSKRWVVSTSTLPVVPGFGPVVEDGVGVAYDVQANSCIFTITCRRNRNYSEALAHQLEVALLEMKGLHPEATEGGGTGSPPKSRL